MSTIISKKYVSREDISSPDICKYLYNSKPFIPGISWVYYSAPYWDEREVNAAIKTLIYGKWLSSGENVHKFEIAFSKKFGFTSSLMVNSGSSANLVMIAALKKYYKWKDGDEIIISVVGFPTTLNAIIQNNLTPVFVDIDLNDLNWDINQIEDKITNKTVAIFSSPVLGNPYNFYKVLGLCQKCNIKFISDNCDSLGSKWDDKYLTDYSVAASCSFYASHHLCSGQGGMVSTRIDEVRRLAESFSRWGNSCFLENAMVYTNAGQKKINDIIVGDEVISHNGVFKPVYETLKRQYSGKLYDIYSRGQPIIKATAEHPFYVLRDGTYQWVEASELKKGDYLLKSVLGDTKKITEINVSYLIHYGKTSYSIPMEADLMRLIGYYMAQGSSTKGLKGSNGLGGKDKNKYYCYRTNFAFHCDHKEYIDDVIILMKKYFDTTGRVVSNKNSKAISIDFKSRKSYEFFHQYCGNRAWNKHLPTDWIYLEKNLLLEFVKGHWRGDGSSCFQSYDISTTSPTLSEQLRFILAKLGIFTTLSVRTKDKHKVAIVNGRPVEQKHDLYNLVIYKPNAIKFGELIGENDVEPSTIRCLYRYFTDDGKYLCHEISKIEYTEEKDISVYNLEVEDDHSYHVNGIIAHNCYCVGAANTFPNGTCGNRFDKWLEDYDDIVDHRYVFENIGYNLKPLDLQGAVGLEQLNKFDEIHEKRRYNKQQIDSYLENIPGIRTIKELTKSHTSWFGVPIVCESKELKNKLVAYLEKNKIQTRNYFSGNILLHPAYKHLGDPKQYPQAMEVLKRVFFIGCAPHYNDVVLNYIKDIIESFKV